jgi:hypothetical protein
MVKLLPCIMGAVALLSPGLAGAETIYDSVNVNPLAFNSGLETSNGSWDWVDPTANGPNASQFTMTNTQSLMSVSLELSADNPTDGGSVVVVLLPNNGGAPPFTTSAGITSFTDQTVLGTIQDNSLSQISSLVTLDTNIPLAAGTYWIGTETALLTTPVDGEDYGSGQWWWTNPDPSVPDTLNFNTANSIGSFAVGGVANPGAYELIINTPEPMTIAILGVGLAGLGYIQRRKARKA